MAQRARRRQTRRVRLLVERIPADVCKIAVPFAVAGALVTCIDSVLDLAKEFSEQVSAFEEVLDKAQRAELPDSEKRLLATRRVQRVQQLAQAARWT